jgi:hypothetical protein
MCLVAGSMNPSACITLMFNRVERPTFVRKIFCDFPACAFSCLDCRPKLVLREVGFRAAWRFLAIIPFPMAISIHKLLSTLSLRVKLRHIALATQG